MLTFVNRERELDRLHELYESDSAELSVVSVAISHFML